MSAVTNELQMNQFSSNSDMIAVKKSQIMDVNKTMNENSSSKKEVKAMSATGSLMHLLKSNIGTGILAMPNAFANSGLMVGSIGLLIIGIVSTHCMHLLTICYWELSSKHYLNHLDYDKVTEEAFKKGPMFLRRMSPLGRRAVNLFLLITLIGISSVYSLFIAENIREFLKGVSHSTINVNIQFILLAMLPLMIAFNCIHELTHLTWGSMIANCLQAVGLGIVIYSSLIDIPPTNTRPMIVDISRLPLFFGTASFAMEAIGMVIPLLKDMKDQKAFGGYFGVLNTAMTIVTCAYIAIGFYGFLKFGNDVKGSITLNLPSTPLHETVRLMFSVAVFHTYALQLYVPINIAFNYFQNRFNLKQLRWKTILIDYSTRVFLVCLTVFFAAIVPKLDLFTSLAGAVSSSFILFIFPPIIEISTFWNHKYGRTRRFLMIFKNLVIIIFGITGIITGTFASLKQIIDSFRIKS